MIEIITAVLVVMLMIGAVLALRRKPEPPGGACDRKWRSWATKHHNAIHRCILDRGHPGPHICACRAMLANNHQPKENNQ